jgi:hypothetical protein
LALTGINPGMLLKHALINHWRRNTMNLIDVDALKLICDQFNCATTRKYTGKCINCCFDAEIEIIKTLDGYGLLGGVLCESDSNMPVVLCADCYKK